MVTLSHCLKKRPPKNNNFELRTISEEADDYFDSLCLSCWKSFKNNFEIIISE